MNIVELNHDEILEISGGVGWRRWIGKKVAAGGILYFGSKVIMPAAKAIGYSVSLPLIGAAGFTAYMIARTKGVGKVVSTKGLIVTGTICLISLAVSFG